MLELVKNFIPSLSSTKHKGEMGRLAVVGGSKEYTGAPYFAGISAMLCGADLVHIICSQAAAPVIKSYSPELIVHPDLDTDIECAKLWLNKTNAVAFGPGLGSSVDFEVSQLLETCCVFKKPIVIDADGLRVITKYPNLIKGNKDVILTPNVVEYRRIFNAVMDVSFTDDIEETEQLAKQLEGVTIVRKGPIDFITNGETSITCSEEGSPRRCGGQGDLLSGAAVTFFNWLSQHPSLPFPAGVGAGLAACTLARVCSRLAFAKYGRSMVTTNMISEIQHAFEMVFGKT